MWFLEKRIHGGRRSLLYRAMRFRETGKLASKLASRSL